MVELKSGETYNGRLKGVDKFMNIQMENCIRTDNVLFINYDRKAKSFMKSNKFTFEEMF